MANERSSILDHLNVAQHDPVSDPPDLDGLPEDVAVDAITDWFLDNFEDPAENTPYESAEGGYQYIWGGPYDTRDVIENVFGDQASEQIIDAAVSTLERHAFDWVPNSRRQQPPEDLNVDEDQRTPAELHSAMQEQASALVMMIDRTPEPPAGLGHNKPPEPLDVEPLDQTDREELRTAITNLQSQPVEPRDNGAAASNALSTVVRLSNKLGAWLAKQGEVFATEAIKAAGKEFGKWAPRAFFLWLFVQLSSFSTTVREWLATVHWPF